MKLIDKSNSLLSKEDASRLQEQNTARMPDKTPLDRAHKRGLEKFVDLLQQTQNDTFITILRLSNAQDLTPKERKVSILDAAQTLSGVIEIPELVSNGNSAGISTAEKTTKKAVKKIVFGQFKKLTPAKINNFFKVLHENDALGTFYLASVDSDTIIHPQIKRSLTQWAKRNRIDLNRLNNYEDAQKIANDELAAEVNNTQNIPSNTIETIAVPDLLPAGDAPESVSGHFEKCAAEGQKTDVRMQDRDAWIMAALNASQFVDHSKTKKYEDPLGEVDQTGETYHVFDIHLINGDRAQVAVNRRVGRGTYIWKDELTDYPKDAGSVTAQELLDRDMVQSVTCKTKDGFVKDVMKLVFTPANQLQPRLKRHVNWKARGMKDAIIALVDQHINDAQDTPPLTSPDVITSPDGRLTTTWRRISGALYKKRIPGLEEFNSLNALVESRMEIATSPDEAPKKSSGWRGLFR